MLGWEYPPLVTGGLGPACKGITEGLASHDVRVLFVVPRASGSTSEGNVEVVDCNEYLGAPVQPPSAPRPPRKLDVLGVDSPLRPYQRPEQYVREQEVPGSGFAGGYGPNLFAEVERYAEVVAERVEGEDFDLIHAHDWMTFPAALRIQARTKKPLVCHIHACEFDRSADNVDERILEIERAGLAAADRVVSVSRYSCDRLHRHYEVPEDKLRVVHNAIDGPATNGRSNRTPKNGGAPMVLFLGRVTAQKGPGFFLDAARQILLTDPDVRFVISGTGDLLPSMVEYAAELGLGRQVRFTGYLTDEEVEEVYGMADLFVLSSVSEPFGLTPLEALVRDVPVIVSRQSGVAEVLATCPKYDYWDTASLADKARTLLRSPGLRRQLAKAGQLEVSNMRWEKRAKTLLNVYRELV